MNKDEIIAESEKVHDDDSWNEFNKRFFFALAEDPHEGLEDFDRQDRRQLVNINGTIWHPVNISAVDKDLKFLHWKLRERIFARLYSEAAAENARHPERYERICIYCEISSAERCLITCPICEHELLNLPLNHNND
jgi:hypothetical protein